jgi:hypothetical protein
MTRRLALVIGSSEYEDTKLARLKTADTDVSKLAELLRNQEIGGFDEVTPVIDQASIVVRRAIARLFAEKRPDDLLLLFFSGHGVRDDNGDLYLAVKDTESDLLSATAIPASFITTEMDRSRSRRQVLILDCCHSGAFARGTKGTSGISVGTAAAFEGSGYGRVVLTASDSTQYAWEGDEIIGVPENSVFSHYLIQGLKNGEADLDADGRITLDELFDYVYGKVVNVTPKQTPGKWAYKQQGEIIIAKNPRPVVKAAELPLELLHAIEHSLSTVREGAVRELERLLNGSHKGLALSALSALERMTDDDSRRVSTAANAILAAYVEKRDETVRPEEAPPEKGPVTPEQPMAPVTDPWPTDPISVVTALLQKLRERTKEIAGRRPVTGLVKAIAYLLILTNILLALFSISGLFFIWPESAMGIVGAVGMLRGQSWGRRWGLVSSLCHEITGLVLSVGIVVSSVARGLDYSVQQNLAFSLVIMSVGIILVFLLGHHSLVRRLGETFKRPAGILPIAILMMLTIIGALPALGVLRYRKWGLKAAKGFLLLVILSSILGTILLAVHHSNSPSYSSDKAVELVGAEATIVSLWCIVAFVYLNLSGVKTWFQRKTA